MKVYFIYVSTDKICIIIKIQQLKMFPNTALLYKSREFKNFDQWRRLKILFTNFNKQFSISTISILQYFE